MDNFRRRVEKAGGINPVTGRGIVDGYEVVDLGLPDGLLWATYNVGATKETEYGYYYKYGRGSHIYLSSDRHYTGLENPLASSADTATQVMGSGWRMPTKDEFQELVDNTDHEWVTNFNGSGINGGKLISKTNPNAYVFFPAAGYYYERISYLEGTAAYVWTSTPNTIGRAHRFVYNNESDPGASWDTRDKGCSVRGVYSL